MKRNIILLSIFTLASIVAFSQADSTKREMQTLFKNKRTVGGYLGLSTRYSNLNNSEALLTGGELSLVVGQAFNFGIERYGLINPIKTSTKLTDTTNAFLNMGYGGFHLEPVLFSKKMVHVTFPVLLGAGGLTETKSSYLEENFNEQDYDSNNLVSTDFFMVAEPGVMLEMNFFRFMRLGAGVSHRFVGGVGVSGLSNNDLSGWSGQMSLRLGWF